jgi:hypothetical protein
MLFDAMVRPVRCADTKYVSCHVVDNARTLRRFPGPI